MNIYEWLTIFSICLIGAITPGPSLIIILYITNTKGFLSGIIASIGHGSGILLYAIISIFSVNLLLKISPVTILIIQTLGSFFLIFISWKILFFKSDKLTKKLTYKVPKSIFESYLIGFTASLINPKVIMFFSAVFSQFLSDDYNTQTKFSMALLASITDVFWYIIASYTITFTIIQNYIKIKQKYVFITCGSFLMFTSFFLIYKSIKNFI